ncbi:MAG: phosphotransferase [Patescibacteria group bacterium]
MQEQKVIDKLIKKKFRETVVSIERMTMGICNDVFLVSLPSRQIIVRLNTDEAEMIGSEKHIPLLKSKGIRVPDIIASDYTKKFVPLVYQIHTKLEGQDLGQVIMNLSDKQLKDIAKEISIIIKKLATIPTNGKFGWIGSSQQPLHDTWLEVLQPSKIIERNKKTGVVGSTYIKMVHKILEKYKDYFNNVKSTFYYNDMSSKNVLIHQGKFSGLVDLDSMAYGDPLEAIGRIKASWYGTKYGKTYTDAVEKNLDLNNNQKEIVTVYAFLNRVHWLSERGIQFNKNTSAAINQKAVKNDKKIIDALASVLKL